MNKKILMISVVFLAVAMLTTYAAPVMAVSPKKISVVFATTNVFTDETEAKIVTNPNGIIHVMGAVRTADATLKIGDGPILAGPLRVDLDYIKFPDITTIMRYRKMTITIPAQFGLDQEGTFVGTFTWTADLTNFGGTFNSHASFQGSGGFEGYTMHIDKEPGEPSNNWVLIH